MNESYLLGVQAQTAAGAVAIKAVAYNRHTKTAGVSAVDTQLMSAPGERKQLYAGKTAVVIGYPIFCYGRLSVLTVYFLIRAV